MLSVERGGRTLGQPTKHVRTHTHKLKPLNHSTVVLQPLSPLHLKRPYIEGAKFLSWCDHKALKRILLTKACTNNNRLNRYRILLSEFDYVEEYKPGPQHAVADALSLISTEGLNTAPIFEEIPSVGMTTRSRAVLDPRLPENRGVVRIPLGELARKQATDEF